MFRIIVLIIFTIFIGRIMWILQSQRHFITNTISNIKEMLNPYFNYKKQPIGLFKFLKISTYLIFLFCITALTFSGFFHPIVLAKPLSGFLLVIHVSIAPVFAMSVAALSMLQAHLNRFNQKDYNNLTQIIRKTPETDNSRGKKRETLLKLCFWSGIVLIVPLILSIVFSMYQYFGTRDQNFLLQLHRYSALLLVIVVGFHSYMTITKK